ncbi:unnamed protein product [Cochlearia groenlandica]
MLEYAIEDIKTFAYVVVVGKESIYPLAESFVTGKPILLRSCANSVGRRYDVNPCSTPKQSSYVSSLLLHGFAVVHFMAAQICAPLVIAHGGFSGWFRDSSSKAYGFTIERSLTCSANWCDFG